MTGAYEPRSRLPAGADDRNRTRNLLFTKQLLCRLSYVGLGAMMAHHHRSGA